jgi:hypothetical protein
MANLRVLGVLVVLAACDRGAVKTGPSCDSVASQIVTVQTKGKQSVNTMEVKGAIAKRCTEDKWTEEARSCISKASVRDDIKKCTHDKLTGEQADKLAESARALGGEAAEAMAKMREFGDKMCQCKDSACAQGVSDEMTKWSMEMAKTDDDPPKMSEEEIKEATEIGTRMGECMVKAMSANMPPDESAGSANAEPAIRPGDRALKEGDVVDGRVIVK